MSLGDVRNVIAAAEQTPIEIKQPMNIAAVYKGGHLVSHSRSDGAWIREIG